MHLTFQCLRDAQKCWDQVMTDKQNVNNTMDFAIQYWGDYYGQFYDPFGHCWSIGFIPVDKDNQLKSK